MMYPCPKRMSSEINCTKQFSLQSAIRIIEEKNQNRANMYVLKQKKIRKQEKKLFLLQMCVDQGRIRKHLLAGGPGLLTPPPPCLSLTLPEGGGGNRVK